MKTLESFALYISPSGLIDHNEVRRVESRRLLREQHGLRQVWHALLQPFVGQVDATGPGGGQFAATAARIAPASLRFSSDH